MLTKRKAKRLAEVNDEICVSIYIPTNRAGEATLTGKDAIMLKNQLKSVKHKLQDKGWDSRRIDSFTQPITDLLEDGDFWRHQSDGLALFLTESDFEYYTLPVTFSDKNYVSNSFYLKPLLGFLESDKRFYLLTLSLQKTKLYLCSSTSMTEIDVSDLIPDRLEDSVGYDYQEKNQNFNTQRESVGSSVHMGHADNKPDIKEEALRYFRDINKGLMKLLTDHQDIPMIVACQDYHFPIYREANTYQRLVEYHVSGNPESRKLSELYEDARDLLKPIVDKPKNEKKERFINSQPKGHTATDIESILTAADAGQIDTLFIREDSEIFGRFNPKTQEVSLNGDNSENKEAISLDNLAAVKVFEQGGSVYTLSPEEMPENSNEIGALYRY